MTFWHFVILHYHLWRIDKCNLIWLRWIKYNRRYASRITLKKETNEMNKLDQYQYRKMVFNFFQICIKIHFILNSRVIHFLASSFSKVYSRSTWWVWIEQQKNKNLVELLYSIFSFKVVVQSNKRYGNSHLHFHLSVRWRKRVNILQYKWSITMRAIDFSDRISNDSE